MYEYLSKGQIAMKAVIEDLPKFEVDAKKRQGILDSAYLTDKPLHIDRNGCAESYLQVAKLVGVSRCLISQAQRVKNQAPELVEEVLNGTIPLRIAEGALRQKRRQRRLNGGE